MTCIAAIAEEGHVWMGGDFLACYGQWLLPRREAKVFKKEKNGVGWVFGGAGRAVTCQLVQQILELPAATPPEENVAGYLVREFVPLLVALLGERKQLKNKDGLVDMDTLLLIGLKGHIFEIDDSFHVLEHVRPFVTIGSGRGPAFGVLYATQGKSISPSDRITLAIEAASAAMNNVGKETEIVCE